MTNESEAFQYGAEAAANPVGRPSLYKPEFCDLLTQHMGYGFSFDSFAALPEVQVAISTLYNWRDAHPEFMEAYKRGLPKRLLFHETAAIGLISGRLPGNAGLSVFMLKNIAGMRDRPEPAEIEVQAEKDALVAETREIPVVFVDHEEVKDDG